MKSLRKFIPLLVIIGTVTGCSSYSSKPGKLENLVGTYELVTYKMKRDDSNPEEEAYDHKAEIGCSAYFSIDKDGYGYYGYKDNETAPRVDSVFSTFIYENEESDLIKAVSMTDGITDKKAYEQKVGCLDESTMGFRDELFKKTLNYTLHSGHMLFQPEVKIKYQYVLYKRVSEEASLSKVNSLLGTNFKFDKPHEMKRCKGFYTYSCSYKDNLGHEPSGAYDYAILDMDSYENGKFDLHYALKEDHIKHDVKVSATVLEKGKSFTMNIFNRTFTCLGDYKSLGSWLYGNSEQYENEELLNSESFSPYFGEAKTLEELITELTTPKE